MVQEKEAGFKQKRKQLEEDHEAKVKELEIMICEERRRLQAAEKELEHCRSELERKLEDELGIHSRNGYDMKHMEDKVTSRWRLFHVKAMRAQPFKYEYS